MLCCATALAACGSDDDGNASDETGGTVSSTATTEPTGPSSTNPSTTDPSGDPTTASNTTPGTTTPSDTSDSSPDTGETDTDPGEPAVHYVGRYDASDPAHVRLGWSGVGFVVRFTGTGATVHLDDAGGYLTVVVDGQVQPTLATSGEQDYVLASGLADGEHVIEVYRRTEGSFGATTIADVTLEGELLPPPAVDRRIEIVGDSITCGYGNEGISPCSFSADTENHYMTYGAIAAREVGAELHTIAWSGKGVIFNYGEDTNQPMPELYDRVIAGEDPPWDYGQWQPDVVAINLGTNDFSTDGDPSQQQFVDAYVTFVTHIREVNPDAYILLLSPSLFGDEATMVDGYLQDVVDQRMGAGDTAIGWANINVEWIGSGCDGHPTVETHMGMAARLVEELGSHVGW